MSFLAQFLTVFFLLPLVFIGMLGMYFLIACFICDLFFKVNLPDVVAHWINLAHSAYYSRYPKPAKAHTKEGK